MSVYIFVSFLYLLSVCQSVILSAFYNISLSVCLSFLSPFLLFQFVHFMLLSMSLHLSTFCINNVYFSFLFSCFFCQSVCISVCLSYQSYVFIFFLFTLFILCLPVLLSYSPTKCKINSINSSKPIKKNTLTYNVTPVKNSPIKKYAFTSPKDKTFESIQNTLLFIVHQLQFKIQFYSSISAYFFFLIIIKIKLIHC